MFTANPSLTTPLYFKRRYLYRKEKESGLKRLKMIRTTKVGQVRKMNLASLEESTQRALTVSQDVKIPDGPIVIDKDLLKEIRDAFDNEAGDGNEYCAYLCYKLDNLYPFLMNISTNNPPVRLNPEEAIKLMDSLDETEKYLP